MRPASLILTLILAILVIGGVVLYVNRNDTTVPNTDDEQVFCTMDAMICPDGSAVGRVPPSCNFAACPVGTSTAQTITLGINQTAQTSGISITPLTVVEDSRCAVDVTCIQAGRVRLSTRLMGQTSSTTQILISNTPIVFGSTTIALTNVTPEQRSTTTIATSTYRFTFSVSQNR